MVALVVKEQRLARAVTLNAPLISEDTMHLTDLRNWLWDQFGWELIDWADDDIRF